MMKALLDSGAEVDLPDGGANGWTALMFALHHDQHEAVRLLLDSGADVNFKNRSGMTPLMIATGDYETQGSAETVRMLTEGGARRPGRGRKRTVRSLSPDRSQPELYRISIRRRRQAAIQSSSPVTTRRPGTARAAGVGCARRAKGPSDTGTGQSETR